MAANPLPLDGNRQLEEASTYRYVPRNRSAVDTATLHRKVVLVFVIYPGKSSPTVAINAARGFLAENDVKILNNQSEMRKRSEEPAHFSSGRRHDERSTRDVLHAEAWELASQRHSIHSQKCRAR
jgi:hypothetical protein